MGRSRKELYEIIEKERNSKILLYYTGDKPYMETRIAGSCISKFIEQLDLIGDVPKITLILDTNGGDVIASWNIINLIRQFCKTLEVIVFSKAMSGGTLICLGADSIMMTKQATLGPIDPSILTPFNPQVEGKRVFVSVEDINGYLELAKQHFTDSNPGAIKEAFTTLSANVHPLVLGYTFRSTGQIRMLANKLICHQVKDTKTAEDIVTFLCSGAASHDYTIDRVEAKALGLNIEKPSQSFYELLKELMTEIRVQLDANRPFSLDHYVNDKDNNMYSVKRLMIESLAGGSDIYYSEGIVVGKMKKGKIIKSKKKPLQDKRTYENWRHTDEIL